MQRQHNGVAHLSLCKAHALALVAVEGLHLRHHHLCHHVTLHLLCLHLFLLHLHLGVIGEGSKVIMLGLLRCDQKFLCSLGMGTCQYKCYTYAQSVYLNFLLLNVLFHLTFHPKSVLPESDKKLTEFLLLMYYIHIPTVYV